MQETQVRSLDQEDPLEKEMATPSSILAWRIPWTEEPGRLQSMWSQRVTHNWATNTFTFNVGIIISPSREMRKHWIFIGRIDAEAEAPILWPPDAKCQLIGKDLDTGEDWRWEEKETTGWDGWMASLTRWTWAWASSGNWWWTGKPGMLQSMGSEKVRHNWGTELNWVESIGRESRSCSGLRYSLMKSLLWHCQVSCSHLSSWFCSPLALWSQG